MAFFLKLLRAIVWIIYALTILAVIVLGFAFVLLLFGASPEAGFSGFIYSIAQPFYGPFEGMIMPAKTGGGVIAWSVLIAMAAYGVLGFLLGGLLDWITRKMHRAYYAAEHPQAATATAGGTAAAPAATAAPEPAQSQPVEPVAQEPAPEPAPAPEPEPPNEPQA